VRGGKGHEVVVGGLGVHAGQPAVAGDGVGGDPAEPSGLADAAPLGDVLQDRLDLLGREPGVEEWGALALGEAGLAGPASEHAARLLGPVVAGDGEVSGPPATEVGAGGIQAAEAREVIHGEDSSAQLLVLEAGCVLAQR
jgi:hypothetical protein